MRISIVSTSTAGEPIKQTLGFLGKFSETSTVATKEGTKNFWSFLTADDSIDYDAFFEEAKKEMLAVASNPESGSYNPQFVEVMVQKDAYRQANPDLWDVYKTNVVEKRQEMWDHVTTFFQRGTGKEMSNCPGIVDSTIDNIVTSFHPALETLSVSTSPGIVTPLVEYTQVSPSIVHQVVQWIATMPIELKTMFVGSKLAIPLMIKQTPVVLIIVLVGVVGGLYWHRQKKKRKVARSLQRKQIIQIGGSKK